MSNENKPKIVDGWIETRFGFVRCDAVLGVTRKPDRALELDTANGSFTVEGDVTPLEMISAIVGEGVAAETERESFKTHALINNLLHMLEPLKNLLPPGVFEALDSHEKGEN